MDKHSKLRELTSFQYWLGTNYSNLPTSSTHMTERARLYLKEQSKDWEILEFKDDRGKLGRLEPNGRYNFLGEGHENTAFSLKNMLDDCPSGNVFINKVKRLSDGEVFEVRDITDMGIIESFYVRDGELYAESEDFEDINFRLLEKVFKKSDKGLWSWAHENEERESGFTRDFYDLQDALKSKYIKTGWQCPKCKTIWSPDTDKCETCLMEK